MFLTVSTFYVSHVQNVITESSEKIKNVLQGRKHIDKIVYSIISMTRSCQGKSYTTTVF